MKELGGGRVLWYLLQVEDHSFQDPMEGLPSPLPSRGCENNNNNSQQEPWPKDSLFRATHFFMQCGGELPELQGGHRAEHSCNLVMAGL